jgi:hypothetical protein
VVFTLHTDYRPTKQPDNNDFLSVIRELHQELRRPLRIQWIKSHQDDQTSYSKLSPDAKLNIDADKLATQSHTRPRSKPAATTAHIPATKMSITINNIRYASNIDANLRFQINGGYLRYYLQQTHGWSDHTWDTINLPALGRHLKTLPLSHHTAHIKFIHDKQPLGLQQLRLAKIKDSAIALCPCCMEHPEDQKHFLHCSHNPARPAALKLLITTLTDTDAHPYGICIAACIEGHIHHPNEPVQIPPDTFENRYKDAIIQAMENQNQIGWHFLLRGFMGLSWLRLASVKPIDNGKPDEQRGNYRIHRTLSAIHTYIRAIWLGRNDVLHQNNDNANATKYSAESTEIRHYFKDPLLLPAEDRHYVSTNLDKILRSSPSVRRRWLRRVRTARSNMMKHGQSQLTIRHFLRPSYQPDPEQHQSPNIVRMHQTTPKIRKSTQDPHTGPHIERTPGRPPDTATATGQQPRTTRTTQQRMTEFFPGRPPDHSTPSNPGNPPHACN